MAGKSRHFSFLDVLTRQSLRAAAGEALPGGIQSSEQVGLRPAQPLTPAAGELGTPAGMTNQAATGGAAGQDPLTGRTIAQPPVAAQAGAPTWPEQGSEAPGLGGPAAAGAPATAAGHDPDHDHTADDVEAGDHSHGAEHEHEHEHDDHDHGHEHEHDVAHGHEHDHDHDHYHDHDHSSELVCAAMPAEAGLLSENGVIANGISLSAGTPLVALADTFRLSSNPTAQTTIYLDFDGHTTTGTSWNNATMGASFYSPAYNTDGNVSVFSNSELTLIQRVWQRVAADFAPFDVNVTTLAPPTDWLIKSSSNDPNYGIRVVMTSYGPSSSTAGGIAYINSFNWDSDTPTFVYNDSLLGVSEAISHEVGHTLGLSHDGTSSTGYYQGHGSGETGWASIMGVGYYQSVTTWDNGTFFGSTNNTSSANYNRGPDDLAIITGYNGFGYSIDQEGSTQATASALAIQGGSVSQFGTIETATDLDWYRFSLSTIGAINLSFDPYWYRSFIDTDGLWGGSANPYYAAISDANTGTAWADNGTNLDLGVELYNSLGTLVASANPTGLAASLNVSNLLADTYYLRLDGVGFGSPTVSSPTGYSDYASIGSYRISGSITGAATLPVISLSLGSNLSVSEDGSSNLVYTFSRSGDTSAALAVAVTLGGTASAGDYALSGLVLGQVQFAAGSATTTVTVDPTADSTQEADETVILQIADGTDYGIATAAAVTGTILNDDVPVVTLSVSPASVTEDGAPNLSYTFIRSYATAQSLVVSYTVAGTAINGTDYSGPSTTGEVKFITIAANATTATLTVNPTADTTIEADETVALSLFAGPGYSIGTTTPVVGTIVNDDLPVITLAIAPASATELGSGTLLYTFSRTGDLTSALTVGYAIGGSAINGTDYTAIGTSVTFAANASTATVAIDPLSDDLVETNETVSLTLQAGSGYSVGTATAVVGTIVNSDPPVITLAVSPAQVNESGAQGGLIYTFSRSTATSEALTVGFSVSGSAINGTDTSAIGTSITFAANASTATLVVNPLVDQLDESDETVEISLSNGSGYTVGTTTPVVGTIVNDSRPIVSLELAPAALSESAGTPLSWTFRRSGPLDAELSVGVSVSGSATAGSDYAAVGPSVTFLAGSDTASLAITPIDDAIAEADETIAISLNSSADYGRLTTTPVVGTILNDDLPELTLSLSTAVVNENGGVPLVYTFSRSGPTGSALTLNYSVAGTATLGGDYSGISSTGTLKTASFAAGSATTTVTVTPIGDTTVEADETVALTLEAGSGYTVGSATPVVGTIRNDDLPAISLSLSPTSVSENGTTNLVFTFTRSATTSDPLMVNFTVGGTATDGSDYTGVPSGTPRSVTIAGGSASAQVVVDPTDDTSVEGSETVVFTLAAGSGYSITTTAGVSGTITDNDTRTQTFTASQDTLTGQIGTDIFTFTNNSLTNSLFVSGTTVDRVISLVGANDRFDSPFRTTAITAANVGATAALSTTEIAKRLSNSRFAANGAVTFTFGSGSSQRTFLAINNGAAGYQSASDAIIEITGFNGLPQVF